MEYEVLVVSKTGKIVVGMPVGHRWTEKERSDRFTIVSFDGYLDELNRGYVYDFTTRQFLKDGKPYVDPPKRSEAPPKTDFSKQLAGELGHTDDVGACEYLHPKHLPFSDDRRFIETRRYFYDAVRHLKHLPGIGLLLAAIMFRDYGDIALAGKSLPASSLKAIFDCDELTDEDKDWIRWSWQLR